MAIFVPKSGPQIEAVRLEREFEAGAALATCFSEQPEWLVELLEGVRIVPRRAPDESAITGKPSPYWRGVTVDASGGPRPMMVGDYLMRGDLGQIYVGPADIFEAKFKVE